MVFPDSCVSLVLVDRERERGNAMQCRGVRSVAHGDVIMTATQIAKDSFVHLWSTLASCPSVHTAYQAGVSQSVKTRYIPNNI